MYSNVPTARACLCIPHTRAEKNNVCKKRIPHVITHLISPLVVVLIHPWAQPLPCCLLSGAFLSKPGSHRLPGSRAQLVARNVVYVDCSCCLRPPAVHCC